MATLIIYEGEGHGSDHHFFYISIWVCKGEGNAMNWNCYEGGKAMAVTIFYIFIWLSKGEDNTLTEVEQL